MRVEGPLDLAAVRAWLIAQLGVELDVTRVEDELSVLDAQGQPLEVADDVLAAAVDEGRRRHAEDVDRDDQIQRLRDKAKGVWRNEDTFTVPQMQRILAGLVLERTREE